MGRRRMGVVEAVQAYTVAALENHFLGLAREMSGLPLQWPLAQEGAGKKRLHVGVLQRTWRVET